MSPLGRPEVHFYVDPTTPAEHLPFRGLHYINGQTCIERTFLSKGPPPNWSGPTDITFRKISHVAYDEIEKAMRVMARSLAAKVKGNKDHQNWQAIKDEKYADILKRALGDRTRVMQFMQGAANDFVQTSNMPEIQQGIVPATKLIDHYIHIADVFAGFKFDPQRSYVVETIAALGAGKYVSSDHAQEIEEQNRRAGIGSVIGILEERRTHTRFASWFLLNEASRLNGFVDDYHDWRFASRDPDHRKDLQADPILQQFNIAA
jgi:hypothetical protein